MLALNYIYNFVLCARIRKNAWTIIHTDFEILISSLPHTYQYYYY
jgi:hypothetical protein